MSSMKIIRFDHLHTRPKDFDKFVENLETLVGDDLMLNTPMDEFGTEVAYQPFPIGVEAFRPFDPSRSLSAKIASEVPFGSIFSICFKVEDLDEATAFMEEHGWKVLEEYPNGDIQEKLFDTLEAFGFYMELISYPFDTFFDM